MPEAGRRQRTMPKAQAQAKATSAHTVTNRATSRNGATRVEAEYTDAWGRRFIVYVEEGEDPASGNIKGPMPLDSLNLPQPLMVRLHNEMYIRGLITTADVMRRPQDVQGAIQGALRLDVQEIQRLYSDLGKS